jgi:hypothetical protein
VFLERWPFFSSWEGFESIFSVSLDPDGSKNILVDFYYHAELMKTTGAKLLCGVG